MASGQSSNDIYSGIYELNMMLTSKRFPQDNHYDLDGIYHLNPVEKGNRWIRDINISIEDSDELTLSITSMEPDYNGEDMATVVIKQSNRKQFIQYLKQVVEMLERNKSNVKPTD